MYVGKRETEEMLIDDFEFYILYNVFPFQIKTRMKTALIFHELCNNYVQKYFVEKTKLFMKSML